MIWNLSTIKKESSPTDSAQAYSLQLTFHQSREKTHEIYRVKESFLTTVLTFVFFNRCDSICDITVILRPDYAVDGGKTLFLYLKAMISATSKSRTQSGIIGLINLERAGLDWQVPMC